MFELTEETLQKLGTLFVKMMKQKIKGKIYVESIKQSKFHSYTVNAELIFESIKQPKTTGIKSSEIFSK